MEQMCCLPLLWKKAPSRSTLGGALFQFLRYNKYSTA